jgi:hypothetical protein
VEGTNIVRNVIFGFVGTAVTFCRPSSNILQNVLCAAENWVGKGMVYWGSEQILGERMNSEDCMIIIHFIQSPLSPFSPIRMILTPKKRGGDFCVRVLFGYRFLSIRIITAPTTAIAMTMPAMPGTKYRSAVDAGGGVGETVAAGASVTDM